jgi:hypothetical protein
MTSFGVAVAALAGACSTASQGTYLTLRTVGETQQMSWAADGGVLGANFQLRATPEGYLGLVGDSTVELTSDGQRIVGVVGDRPVNLHLKIDGDGVRARGMFAGQIGSLVADRFAISSWLGGCHYALQVAGPRFQGERICRSSQVFELVTIELSRSFAALPAARRAMLLALLLGA